MGLRLLLTVVFFLAGNISSEAIQFPYQTPYQQAVPQFLDEITNAIKDIQNLSDIGAWEQETRARFPEFLDDLTQAVVTFSNQPFGTYDAGPFEDFVSKWDGIVHTYPGLDQVTPLVAPIVSKFLGGLPQARSTNPNDQPFQNYDELYQQMEALDPFSVGSFFHREPLENEQKTKMVDELLNEQTNHGIKSTTIIRRLTTITINGVIVKYEKIEDGVVVDRFIQQKDTSLLHETLRKLKEDNGNPQAIALLETLVEEVDKNLKLAFDQGQLDPAVYHYLYGGEPRFLGLHPSIYLFPMTWQGHFPKSAMPVTTVSQRSQSDVDRFIQSPLPPKVKEEQAVNVTQKLNNMAVQIPALPDVSLNQQAQEYPKGFENAFTFGFVFILMPLFVWMSLSIARYALSAFEGSKV